MSVLIPDGFLVLDLDGDAFRPMFATEVGGRDSGALFHGDWSFALLFRFLFIPSLGLGPFLDLPFDDTFPDLRAQLVDCSRFREGA